MFGVKKYIHNTSTFVYIIIIIIIIRMIGDVIIIFEHWHSHNY